MLRGCPHRSLWNVTKLNLSPAPPFWQYFYGVLPNSKYICIYDTLMEKSTPDEVEAILAHELGHWAHSDPTKLLVLSQVQIITILSLFTLFIHNASLFRAFGFDHASTTVGGKLHSTVESLLGRRNNVSVKVAYLPIVVGLELFQLVMHPLDSLGEFEHRKWFKTPFGDKSDQSPSVPLPSPSQVWYKRSCKENGVCGRRVSCDQTSPQNKRRR
jgi:hypothetical protein